MTLSKINQVKMKQLNIVKMMNSSDYLIEKYIDNLLLLENIEKDNDSQSLNYSTLTQLTSRIE